MTTPFRSLSQEHLDAMNAALRSQQCQRMADSSIKDRVGLFEEAMLIITRVPLWARCTVDTTVISIFSVRYHILLLSDVEYETTPARTYDVVRSLGEAFQVVYANKEWKSEADFVAHIQMFFGAFAKCLEQEKGWISDDGRFELGESALDFMRTYAADFIKEQST